ncbi:MAG TPA: hypothetical protein VF080_04850 [Solirubrobacteraceae bacterium]
MPAALAACALAGATAQANDQTPPVAQTLAPTGFAGLVVVLHGTVDPGHQRTTYWFEIGPTTAYGSTTQPVTIDTDHPVNANSIAAGLLKGATYHARLVARSSAGLSLGSDVSFAVGAPTASAPQGDGNGNGSDAGDDSGSGAPSGQDPASSKGKPSAPVLAPPAPPELGQTFAAAPRTGNVLVRLPGSTHAVALDDAASIPVGSILDARRGTVALSSALPGDHTQTGTFHGGLFEVRQPAGTRGMTELVLRGPQPSCTGARAGAGTARAAAAAARRPPRGLWGRDDHGRFRTRGSNSVATVRGTAWYVEDRCDGTLTRVSKGSVSVRDLRRERTVIVNAGKSYLARGTR